MKRKFSLCLAAVIAAGALLPLTSCKKETVEYLNVFNAEEYISEFDEEWGTLDVIAEFEKYASKERGHTVKVKYSTFGTLENMYNELQLTKRKSGNGYTYSYDLVCPSDYMIQRMIKEDMLEKFDVDEAGKYEKVGNYNDYASPFITDLFEGKGWNEYAVGYMWGTMGFIYNPEVLAENNSEFAAAIKGVENQKELVKKYEDFVATWELPWNSYYKNLGTIKDSIRDTYALAVGYVYRDALKKLNALYSDAEVHDPTKITVEEYRDILVKIFNNVDSNLVEDVKSLDEVKKYENEEGTQKAIEIVRQAQEALKGETTVKAAERELKTLKTNVYGFEVDSGKKDMAAGKIAINFAWSGDAAYTLDLADDDDGATLYYAVPKEGSNIWFDAWVMPKGANKDLAQMFVNFLSDPEIAISNMDYIGYVSPIAGDDVFDYICDAESYDLTLEPDADHTEMIDYTYFFSNISDDKKTDGKVIVYSKVKNIGRQLTVQYPTKDVVDRCAIMTAFNRNELKKVNAMWSDVKVGNLPLWLLISVPAVIVFALLLWVTLAILKKHGIKIRLPRRNYGTLISSERIK